MPLALSVVVLVAFVRHSLRAAAPLLDLRVLVQPVFSRAIFVLEIPEPSPDAPAEGAWWMTELRSESILCTSTPPRTWVGDRSPLGWRGNAGIRGD